MAEDLKAQPSRVVLPERAIAGNDQAYMYVSGRNHAIDEMAAMNSPYAGPSNMVPDGWSVIIEGDSVIVRPKDGCAVELNQDGTLGERVIWRFMRELIAAPSAAPAPGECVAVPDGLHGEAERCAFVLENIGSMDAEDIDGDDIDLRFEDAEGRDTGCDVSIVEYAERGAKVIRAILAQRGKAVTCER